MPHRKPALVSLAACICLGAAATLFAQPGGLVSPIVVKMDRHAEDLLHSSFQTVNGLIVRIAKGHPSGLSVSGPDGLFIAFIPIAKDPAQFVYADTANTAYILQRLQFHPAADSGPGIKDLFVPRKRDGVRVLTAVNLSTLKVDREIPIAPGALTALHLSPDSRRIYIPTAGKGKIPLAEAGFIDAASLETPYDPKILVLDTSTNQVIATLRWLPQMSAAFPAGKKFFGISTQFVTAASNGTLVIHAVALLQKSEPIDRLVVFHPQSDQPALFVDPGGVVVASILSADESHLLAAVAGDKKKKQSASLVAVDLSSGSISRTDVAEAPLALLRFGPTDELWALGRSEMRALTETGEPTARHIPLNPPQNSPVPPVQSGALFLDGLPGETLSVGNGKLAMQVVDKSGGSKKKVALIDLDKLEIQAILPTVSGAESKRIATGRILGSALLTSATFGLIIFIPNLGYRNQSLAAPPDNKLLYVLAPETHNVSVIDLQDRAVIKRIKVDDHIVRLQISADGKRLLCFGDTLQQIDLATSQFVPRPSASSLPPAPFPENQVP